MPAGFASQLSESAVALITALASAPSFLLGQLSLEGVFGALAGLGEIAVGAFDQWILVAVRKLASHGIVSGLVAFVGLE